MGEAMLSLSVGPVPARAVPGPPAEAAVLVVDVQHGFADPAECPWLDDATIAAIDGAIARTRALVEVARAAAVPVVWVRLVQREHAPWRASDWFREYPPGEHGMCVAGTRGVDWYGVEPAPGELVVDKHRYNGFLETPLDASLRAMGVTWFVACGLSTECCVESTVRGGFELGYRVVVAGDACAAEGDLHAASLESMARNFALVADVDAVAAAWVAGWSDQTGEGS